MSNDAEMPGAWTCDKCGFGLQKSVLHAGDGNISADTSPLNEICPNDGALMRPLTWREVNKDLFNRACELTEKVRTLERLLVEKNETANVFMNQVKKLQAELHALKNG